MEFRIIGVPVFEGCNIRGVEKAPAVIRESGCLEYLKSRFTVVDCGDIELLPSSLESMLTNNPTIKYSDVVLDMGEKLCAAVKQSINEGAFPLIIGGDHSLGVGSVAGSSLAQDNNIGVVWVDAHSDINTAETSPSKNYHGMPLASSLYEGDSNFRAIGEDKPKVKPENTFLVAVRSMDEGETKLRDRIGINHYMVVDIQQKGASKVAKEIANKLADNGVNKLHLSFDMDVLSPEETGAFNCPVSGGLTKGELLEFFAAIFSLGVVSSMDITEYNPDNDGDGKGIAIIKEIIKCIADNIS